TKQNLARKTAAAKELERDLDDKDKEIEKLNAQSLKLEIQKPSGVAAASTKSSSSGDEELRDEIDRLKTQLDKSKKEIKDLTQDLKERKQAFDDQQKELSRVKSQLASSGAGASRGGAKDNGDDAKELESL